jgi:restriction system protein
MDLWFLEKNLYLFFREQNYTVEVLQKPDADTVLMILAKNGQKTLLLGRTSPLELDHQIVQQSVQAKVKYKCAGVVIAVNSKFTREAQKMARLEKVELWDNKKTRKNLLSVSAKNIAAINLPGTGELEKALQDMSVSLGINSSSMENNNKTNS